MAPQRAVGADVLASELREAELIEKHRAGIFEREMENRSNPRRTGSTNCRLCGSEYNIYMAKLGEGLCKACSEESAAIRDAKLEAAQQRKFSATLSGAGYSLQSAALAQVWMLLFSLSAVLSAVVYSVLAAGNLMTRSEWHEHGAGVLCALSFFLLVANFIAWILFVVKLYRAGTVLRIIDGKN